MFEFKDAIFAQLIISGSDSTIQQFRRTFLSNEVPVWAKLQLLVDLRYKERIEGTGITFPVGAVPIVRTKLGESVNTLSLDDSAVEMRDLTTMTAQELSRYLVDGLDEAQIEALVGNSHE